MNKLFFFILLYKSNMFNFDKKIYNGRKIKNNKSPEKIKIKKSIISRLSNFQQNNFHAENIVNFIDQLSISAEARYKINNFYVNEIHPEEKFDQKTKFKKIDVIAFIMEYYNTILSQINIFNFKEKFLFNNIYFLSVINDILHGEKLNTAIKNNIVYLKDLYDKSNLRFLFEYDIITLLENKKLKSVLEKNNFDNIATKILKKILIYNGSNLTEIDRVINRVYNKANRKVSLLIIHEYEKDSFNHQEVLNTYGELDPAKDVYEKILFESKKLQNESERGVYNMLHRNIPEKKGMKISSYIIIPEIKSNITEYFILENGESGIKKIKIDNVIKNFDKNKFYLISVLDQREIKWILN